MRHQANLRQLKATLEQSVAERTAGLQANLDAMRRLHTLGLLSAQETSLPRVLQEIVDAAIAITAADFGNIQLLDPASGDLRIVAQRGFPKWWVKFWSHAAKGKGVCGTALKLGKRVIVQDVERSRIFAGTPALRVQLKAGVRAVQSTPLVSRSGRALGMFSTHYKTPQRPDGRTLSLLDLLARQAADLIEHTQAEAAVQKSEQRYRALVQAASDAVYQMSADWTEMRLLVGRGFIADTREPSRSWLQKYIHPEDQQQVLASIQKAIRTRSVFELEHRIRRADGSIGWTLSRATPIFDTKGEIIEWFGMASDVSTRRQSEAALRESETRLRLAAGAAKVGLWDWDLRTNAVYFSPEWKQQIGYREEEIPNRFNEWQSRVHPEDLEPTLQKIRAFLKTPSGPHEVEFRFRHKDGSYRWIYTLSDVLRDETGRPVRMLGCHIDITARKKAEEAVRLSEKRLAQAQRMGHIGSWEWDLRTGKVAWSDELYSIYGLDRASYKPTVASFIPFIHPDDLGRVRKAIRQVLSAGNPVNFEFRIRRTDGALRTLHTIGEVTAFGPRGTPTLMVGINQDITERKEAEAVIQATQAKLQAALQSMTDAVFISDAEGNFIHFNDAFATFHKFKSRDQCPKRLAEYPKILDVYMANGELLPLNHWAVPRALRGETGINVEYSLRRKDTGEKWVGSYNFCPIRDPRGRIVGAVVVGRDITTQKAANEALRESEVRFRTIFDAAGDGMFLSEVETGRFHLANKACLELLGYSLPEFLKLELASLHRPEDLPMIRAEIARFSRGETPSRAEVHFRRKDGALVLTEVTPTPVRLGGKNYALVVLRDITSNKEAELARSRLAAIVESSTDAISAMDLHGVITDWTESAERLYGYSTAEAVGKPIGLIVPPDRRSEIALFIERIGRGERISSFETIRVRKDGQYFPVALSLSPVLDAAGCIVGSSAISRDISDRKRFERQLLEAAEREQRRIGHDLHDGLCQELNGLSYLANLLEKELRTELPTRAAEAERLGKLLGQSLLLSRKVARGLQPVQPVPDGLMLTLREMAERTQALYKVDCCFECRRPVLIQNHSAAAHLYRIAQEAVNNAIKHGRPTRIRILLKATPQAIILGVHDNGVGIRRGRDQSLGMGLHIMQYRANAIHGSLVVQRHPKGGTEVVCTIANRALLSLENNQNEKNANA